MFDCPEQSHTSPDSILSIVSGSPSSNVMLSGPPAAGVERVTVNLPEASAFTLTAFPHEGVTVTFAPGAAIPGILISVFC